MGQRLNIQIEANNPTTDKTEVLANCYYHWSGYTSSAMELVNEIVDSGIYKLDILDPVEKAIRLLEATGAGLAIDELTDTYNTPKYNVSYDRNKGLIAISEEGTNNVAEWEESRVTINLTTGSIYMSGMFYDETYEYSSEMYKIKLKKLYKLKADLNSSFDTFQALYTELTDNIFKNSHVYGEYDMFVQDGSIYSLIEQKIKIKENYGKYYTKLQ